MKQYLTLEQWNELSEKQKEIFCSKITSGTLVKCSIEDDWKTKFLPTIGEMIEYLGDELTFIEWGYSPRDVKVLFRGKKYNDNELLDALWQACVYKLNN